jgi:16S rRNA (guanine966-N2)-methyltransferase
MRVIAGRWRGHPLRAPAGRKTRPTPERVREAWMSALQPYIPGARVLDLFAGSGALGLEALSRGAERVVFVEKSRRALDALEGNIATLKGAKADVEIVRGDAMSYAKKLEANAFDIVLADPPYDFTAWDRLLGLVRSHIVVVESDRQVEPPAGWSVTRSKRYGRTWVVFLER